MVLLSDLLRLWLHSPLKKLLLQSRLVNERQLRFRWYHVFIVYPYCLLCLSNLIFAVLRLAFKQLRPNDTFNFATVLRLVSACQSASCCERPKHFCLAFPQSLLGSKFFFLFAIVL